MEDDFSGLFFSTSSSNLNKSCTTTINLGQQFSVSSIFPSSVFSNDAVLENGAVSVTEANDLLENGILVETSKGLVCLSLKDAITSEIAGLNLSVEDLQNVAAQLLIAQNMPSAGETIELETEAITLGGIKVNVLPDIPQLFYKMENGDAVVNPELSVEMQIEISEKPGKPAPKKGNAATQSKFKKASTTVPKEVKLVSPLVPENLPLPTSNVVLKTTVQSKKRGGWPKGRKRKPEVVEVHAPKAPATGYVLYLNENRKHYKDLPFPEVTKILGNLWSNLSLVEKQIYLDRADIEKKRYREELKAYRHSDAYQAYLTKKRMKRLQGNGTEESDMDATDEIEDEDNEELYCRTCDQWFSSHHNKKEHLYGRQHLQVIAGDFTKEQLAVEADGAALSSYSLSTTSLDESSLDGLPAQSKGTTRVKLDNSVTPTNMVEAITRFMESHSEREREIKVLNRRLKDMKAEHVGLITEIGRLKERETTLLQVIEVEREKQVLIEQQLYHFGSVHSHMYDDDLRKIKNDNVDFNS